MAIVVRRKLIVVLEKSCKLVVALEFTNKLNVVLEISSKLAVAPPNDSTSTSDADT